jgi:hypothetical protein
MSMTMVFLGIDLAKSVSALHGVDATGRRSVRRDQLLESQTNGASTGVFALIRVSGTRSRSKDRL